VLATGCLQPARYPCEKDDQCERDGMRGVCSDAGWCAYDDDECPSGLRYSPIADESLAKKCVPIEVGTESSSTAASSTTSAGSAGSTGTTTTTDTGASSTTAAPDCESTCIPGPHVATAMCDETGQCIVTCEPPWQDCDGDVATGCEVPVGVPHQCDGEGLDPVEGCWTAWCGASDGESAINFGTYYCVDCITCQQPTAGQCRWCDHDTGHWFTPADCVCSPEALGAVCGP